jgi:hypothetical protein
LRLSEKSGKIIFAGDEDYGRFCSQTGTVRGCMDMLAAQGHQRLSRSV